VSTASASAQLLCELIEIPSVNPAFLAADDPRAGEHQVAERVTQIARQAGLEVSRQPVVDRRANILARLSPSGTVRRRLLLAPHLDTVGFPGLDDLLHPRVSRGRIIGRGACDTKGCVAAMLTALMSVARKGPRPTETEITFLGLIDEENGQLGSRHYAQNNPPADLAIVGEPTRLEVVTAHKGDVWLQLKTTGRSAHGATPHLGRNAVHAMGKVVDLLETTYRQQLLKRSHPLLGAPTINVGAIRGGTQPNIVPDQCTIAIDRRTLPGESEALVRREISALLRQHGLKASFDSLRLAPCHPLETSPDLPWVQDLCRAARRQRTVGVHYFCDAAPLAEAGTPAVVFGPGDIAQAHTNDEWISITSLDRGTAILERFLRSLP
jgi:acetylornithine deacetylase/succinyl-diaminopimelate desuccinylase-like protein